MFTLNIKGQPNPRNKALVKLELIFFKRGYARVTKVLNITGELKDWNSGTQSFNGRSVDTVAKNKKVLDQKLKYQSVAEDWDAEGRIWTPVELSHCFDEQVKEKEVVKVRSLSQMIDFQIDKFNKRERIKNGVVVDCSNHADSYKLLKTSLTRFCRSKYNRALSSYYFKDITDIFLLDYTMYIKKRGIEMGNKGGLIVKLKLIRAMVNLAIKMGITGISLEIFDCLGDNLKWDATTSKAISTADIYRIENIDRSLFSDTERFCLDLFFFSYYTGGMANVDVCHLTWDSVKDGYIIYERMKCVKTAKPILNIKAERIMNKYKGQGYQNYIFPVFNQKHNTTPKQSRRVALYSSYVSKTLRKVCKILKIKENMTWYSARGSFISRMIDEGYSAHVIADMAGNSPMMISKHYYKNTNGDDIREKMNREW